jgi:hypothetical protein
MLRPALATDAPVQGSRLLNRQAAASAIIAGAVTFALFFSAHAFAQPPATSARMAQEQHACAIIMGLHQPGDLYDTCISSLDKTLSALDRAQLVATDRSACAQRGLNPGTPASAVCVVDAEQSPVPGGPYAAIAPRQ